MSVGHLVIVTAEILYGNYQDQEMKTLNPYQVIQEVAVLRNPLQPLLQVKEMVSVKLQEAHQQMLVDKVQVPQVLEVVKPQVKVTEVEMLQLLVTTPQEMPVEMVAEMFHKPTVQVVLVLFPVDLEVALVTLAPCKR